MSNVVESGSGCSSSKLMSGVIVNKGAFCSAVDGGSDEDDTVFNGVRNVLGSKLSEEEFGRNSASRTMDDSSNKGDRGRTDDGYPEYEHAHQMNDIQPYTTQL